MIMRISWGKVRDGKWKDYERFWKENAAKTKGTPGLKGRWLSRDGENAGYSVSVWETREAHDEYVKNAPHFSQVPDFFIGQFITDICEVSASDDS